MILVQKVGCFVCLAHQYFQRVKMALGSKRLDTPGLNKTVVFIKKGLQDFPKINKKTNLLIYKDCVCS